MIRDTDVITMDGAMPLNELVTRLLQYEIEVYRLCDTNARIRKVLGDTVDRVIRDYQQGDPSAHRELHQTLAAIYSVHFATPLTKNVNNQWDPDIVRIQRRLEDAWEMYEQSRIPHLDIPQDPRKFIAWFKELVLSHPATDHALYHYLQDSATRTQVAHFFVQETTIDTRFDDLVALAQVGMDGPPKMELGQNYWDEMGNGNPALVHTTMFNQLLEELAVQPGDDIPVLSEALACGNVLSFTILHRRNAWKGLGALGVLEMISPQRFRRLVKGFGRIGLSSRAQQYHALHVSIDARHGHGWLHRAIRPLIEQDPSIARDIVYGGFYRLNTSLDYVEHLTALYTSGAIQ
ncbi:iron-containing redox enzyme family protein [Sulfobacillus thermosulfidooxidans]|uniref:iron-containing redox enzyme family protein n=1 Tax=Sulfobacillus thermosulfidooxidans TaxID=28034 RepID=UPI0006B5E4DD|nr:iron-containing redox enzyme family protein [Sulfobacillus thermosulfidooxidans]